jgi:ribosomal protein S18 acetylase RimI-like enzyme
MAAFSDTQAAFVAIRKEASVTMIRAPFRRAIQADASALAELVNYAGEGMPFYLWGKLVEPGETAWDVGRRRAAREGGSFSYRNAVVVEHEGQCAGCLIGYEIPDDPPSIAPDLPAMFVPLQQLENMAPSTWYVNVLAVLPQFRNRGLGTELLSLADETGRALGKRGMSVIVSDANVGARRLYERQGYRAMAQQAMKHEGWATDGLNWVLLAKNF